MDATAPLKGRVALVAGATRGAGRQIAVQLGAAGATVYCTGRTTRERPSEMGRPETIEETAEMVTAAGGNGIGIGADHLDPRQVRDVVARIDAEQGCLDVLVNDIWGAEGLFSWDKKLWEDDLDVGLHILRLAVDTHIVTSHAALPLLVRRPGGLVVEVTDGTAEYNESRYRVSFFYDLAKASVLRMAFALSEELKGFGGTAVSLTPGFLRSELMLEHFGVTEANWRDGAVKDPHFAMSETPVYIGRGVAALAADPDRARWNGASLSSAALAKEYGFTDADGSRPDWWRYDAEVIGEGRPVTTEGYR
ncbi:MAG TPA: SDR family oxidoreductase [Dactylosporangium sp.]|jgi:NAD(P)-dependent dehydrogenase (short-subunit alcohol dehydrogenase family)|nr:SDR family oxidoreductase [Dactylosporangium sp.]